MAQSDPTPQVPPAATPAAATPAPKVAGDAPGDRGGSAGPEQPTPLPEVDKAHFTADEAAAYMGVSLQAFQVLAADPDLQPVRILGVYHYRVADVQRFMLKMEADEGA